MSRIPNIFQRLTGAETPMNDDVTSLSKDIERIRAKAEKLKRLADEMKTLDDLLKKIENMRRLSHLALVKTMWINEPDRRHHEITFAGNSDAFKRLDAKIEDALREYIGDQIRATYEEIEKEKETL